MTLGLTLIFLGGLLILAGMQDKAPWEPITDAFGGKGDAAPNGGGAADTTTVGGATRVQSTATAPTAPTAPTTYAHRQTGKASWYDCHNEGTACGGPNVNHGAAHRTLPCGTRVKVTSGGKSTHVIIRDRGPFGIATRILDLCPEAFRDLAPLSAGVISVVAEW